MDSEKRMELIEAVKNLPDWEADILEVFLAGFRAGRQGAGRETECTSQAPPADRAGRT